MMVSVMDPGQETPERPRCPVGKSAHIDKCIPRAMGAVIYRTTKLGRELVPTAAYTFFSSPYPTIAGLTIHVGCSSCK